MGRDRDRRSPNKRGKFHNSPKWPPAVLYHSEANNGQAGVGFLINKKWKYNITRVSSGSSRVAEIILRITNFYNTIDKILEKQNHCTMMMFYMIGIGDFNAKFLVQTNTSERATGCFGLGQQNERRDTLLKWTPSNNVKMMNTQLAGRRWTW